MKTLKLAFTILLCMVFVNSFSQTVFYQAAIRNGSAANATFQKFNKNTTIFLCPKPLENDADELRNFLKENWTLTPIRLVPFDSIDAFIGKPEYNLFMCKASCIYMGTMPLNYNFNFCLSVFNGKTDKGEWDYQDISRMILAPVDTFLNECTKKKTKLMKKYNAAYDMYGDGAFYNFSLANVELFIKSINYYFTNNKAIGTNSIELDKLKTSKLFVPYYEWMDINMNAMNGRQKHDLSKDNKAFKNYKYQYEKIDNDKLLYLVSQNSENFYLNLIIQTSGVKWYQVVNTNTGEIIFDSNSTSNWGEAAFECSQLSLGMFNDLDVKRITEKMSK